MRKLLLLMSLLPSLAQAADYDTVRVERVFTDQVINFNPKTFPDGVQRRGDAVVLGNGRIWLRKVALPKGKRHQRASVKIRLQSNGDPWDKSGSCFVIPATTNISMFGVAGNTQQYPEVDAQRYEQFRGFVATKDFAPPVELLRFMTPFGVGAFTPKDSTEKQLRTPVYVDGFAPYVEWEADITDRLPLLTDSVYVGVTIDTWTEAGYRLDLRLTVEESQVKGDKAKPTQLKSLVNTYLYLGQNHCDIFNRQPLQVPFELPKAAKNARLFFITTGHGGHSGGDEFVPCEHILSVDGREVKRFTPWRTDCASFRRFNPSTGVWLVKRKVNYITENGKRDVKEIEEPIGSSDLSRSNWCPGSDVMPEEIRLGHLAAGKHTFLIDIPKAQAIKDNLYNHWLVSAWLVWEE